MISGKKMQNANASIDVETVANIGNVETGIATNSKGSTSLNKVQTKKCAVVLSMLSEEQIVVVTNRGNVRYWNDRLIWFVQWRVLFLSSFTVVVDWSKSTTCLQFHTLIYSKYDIPKYVLCFRWFYAQFMNTRLVMMSASLCTQTGLHCLNIQVLHRRIWFLNVQYTSLSLLYTVI